MHTEQKVILAADELDRETLLKLIRQIGPKVFAVKIHNLYDLYGPDIIGDLRQVGAKKVWVDYKLHDIPNTARLRAEALAKSGCDILTAHASGGSAMLAEVKAVFGSGKVYAVTALTSLSGQNIQDIYQASATEVVQRLALLAKTAAVDGIVCSPQEIVMLRQNPEFKNLELVVPGIRSSGISANDQQRVATPAEALSWGADYLVMGRQITKAADPAQALEELEQELSQSLTNV